MHIIGLCQEFVKSELCVSLPLSTERAWRHFLFRRTGHLPNKIEREKKGKVP